MLYGLAAYIALWIIVLVNITGNYLMHPTYLKWLPCLDTFLVGPQTLPSCLKRGIGLSVTNGYMLWDTEKDIVWLRVQRLGLTLMGNVPPTIVRLDIDPATRTFTTCRVCSWAYFMQVPALAFMVYGVSQEGPSFLFVALFFLPFVIAIAVLNAKIISGRAFGLTEDILKELRALP